MRHDGIDQKLPGRLTSLSMPPYAVRRGTRVELVLSKGFNQKWMRLPFQGTNDSVARDLFERFRALPVGGRKSPGSGRGPSVWSVSRRYRTRMLPCTTRNKKPGSWLRQ